MHPDWSDQVELASDIEWLLLNDQTKTEDLLVNLVDDFGAGFRLLLQCIFNDAITADNVLVETLVQIVLHRHRYQAGQAVKVWLYSQAIETAWQERRKWIWVGTQLTPQDRNPGLPLEQGTNFPDWLEHLPDRTRLVTVLHRYIGFGQNEIAEVLRIPAASITQILAIVDRVFPSAPGNHEIQLHNNFQQHLLEATLHKLKLNQPHGKFRRNLLEVSWVLGAVMLIALLTRAYDFVNPDPVRQAVEFSLLTPLPTTKRETLPTATTVPWIDISYSSEEIALRIWQRWSHLDTIWVDYLIILSGAQGGPTGVSLSRVEIAWDFKNDRRLILVGTPDGLPEYALLTEGDRHTFELFMRDGRLVETQMLDTSQPNHWLYLADLALNLQINNFEGNWTFRPEGDIQIAGREALAVSVANMQGGLNNFIYLDTFTAIPLVQQRYREAGVRDEIVLYTIANQISINEPIPDEQFEIDTNRQFQFRSFQDPWIKNSIIEAGLPSWVKLFSEQTSRVAREGSPPYFYYQVSAVSNQEVIRYSTQLFAGQTLIGEYPMGNPWSVVCERSPDGRRVAFIEDRRFEFGTTFPSKVLHWFSIDVPNQLNTPLPGKEVTQLAFSPDSRFLAVHASNEISLIDLESGEVTYLLEVPTIDRLVFSDDGNYLGVLRSPTQSSSMTYIWIIHLPNRMVVEALKLGPNQDWDSQRAEIFATRQVDFTKPIYFGLENCR